MELKIKDKLFLVVAIFGFIAFFLPWIGGGFTGRYSGYDLLTYGKEMGLNESWFLLLLPISFVIIIFSKLGFSKQINPILLKITKIIPIALILISILRLLSTLDIRIEDLSEIDGGFFEILDIGFFLTIASSVIVSFNTVRQIKTNN